MDIESLIAPYKDIEEFKSELNNYREIIVDAAHDYSKMALDESNNAFNTALEGGPVFSVLQPLADHQEFSDKAAHAAKAVVSLDSILLELEDSTQKGVNEANALMRKKTSQTHYIYSDLEGAQNRAYIAKQTIPNVKLTMNTMCDPKLLEQAQPDDEDE